MTGIKYACEGGACLKKTLEHLDDVKPEVLIVKTMTEKFGVVLKVLEPIDNAEDDDMETTEKRGVISRVDLMDMLHLMEVSGYDVIAGKVAYVSKLGHALVEVDVPDDFMVCGADGIDAWHDWNWVNAMAEEGVIDYEMFSEAQEAIRMLDLALEQPGALSDTMTVKCIRKLIKVSRFDVSMETQRALARYRQLVPQHPSEKVKAMTDALVKAINDIGSKERMVAFRDEYFPQVKARLDARRKELERHSPSDRDALRQSAYEALRRLPDNLFYDISDKGEMMHRLLYIGNGIPRKKLMMLLDAVSVWEEEEVEKIFVASASADEELFHFVHPLLDNDKAWDVHKCVRHLVCRFGVQEICDYLIELRNEKKILLPQSLMTAYDELRRMGMPCETKGYDYKTFAKYYNK